MPSSPFIRLNDVTVRYDGVSKPVLDRVSLDVSTGAWIAVAGDNGSGKTTLLTTLAGLNAPAGGTREHGASRTGDGPARIAMLFQDPDNQFVATSVRHELVLSLPDGAYSPGAPARLADAIDRFALAALLERNPHRLSGGEKQRLALATVWLEVPDVLLLDEPLAYLDAETRDIVVGFVRGINADGVAIVWATPGEDAALARETVWLDSGPVRVLSPAPPRRVSAAGAPSRRHPHGLASGSDRTRAESRHPHGLASAEGLILEMNAVSFSYDDTTVLRDVTLKVAAGECVGVTGRNSAGKSTLLLVAGGALAPGSGTVRRAANDAMYLPQSPERMFFAETIRDEIAFGLARRGVAGAEIDRRAAESLEAAGLDPATMLARSPFQVSMGEMRRVAFAVADSLSPSLLLLDEPAAGLDDAGRVALDRLIQRRVDAGAAVVIASHDPGHLAHTASRVVRVEHGTLQGP